MKSMASFSLSVFSVSLLYSLQFLKGARSSLVAQHKERSIGRYRKVISIAG